MTIVRKVVAGALAGLLAVAPLAACSGNGNAADTQAETKADTKAETETQGSEKMVGGWEVNTEAASMVSDDERQMFEQAAAKQDAKLTPIAVVATQVVAGRNFAYLCLESKEDGTSQWSIAVVYQDLQGEVSLTSNKPIDIADLKTKEPSVEAEAEGAWTIQVPGSGNTLGKGADEAFQKAAKDYADASLTPLALLGTQVVAGTNYLVLCEGSTTGDNPLYDLYVAQIYADLEDKATMSEVKVLDLLAYL